MTSERAVITGHCSLAVSDLLGLIILKQYVVIVGVGGYESAIFLGWAEGRECLLLRGGIWREEMDNVDRYRVSGRTGLPAIDG